MFAELAEAGKAQVARDGIAADDRGFRLLWPTCAMSARSTPSPIPVRDPEAACAATSRALRALFDAEHDQRYGQAAPDERLEIVNVRLVRHRRAAGHAGRALAVRAVDAGAAGRRTSARDVIFADRRAAGAHARRLAAVAACRLRASKARP